MDLLSAAKQYAESPSDVGAMTTFVQALADTRSPDLIKEILALDFERIAGPALDRLLDLLPDDIDLLLTAAIWKYHFGLDDEALRIVDQAKQKAPFDPQVLQIEIFLNYGQDVDHIRSLCEQALHVCPGDAWLRGVLETIETTGQLTTLNAPPLRLHWHAALTQ